MPPKHTHNSRYLGSRTLIACVAGAIFTLVLIYGFLMVRSPDVPLLVDNGEAGWIRYPSRQHMGVYQRETYTTYFRKQFVVTQPPVATTVYFTAFRAGSLLLDGTEYLSIGTPPVSWKNETEVQIPAAVLTPGVHTLEFRVTNSAAPPFLRVRIPQLSLYSGTDWEASVSKLSWKQAEPAGRVVRSELFQKTDTPLDAVIKFWKLYASVFAAVFIIAVFRVKLAKSSELADLILNYFTPGNVRWLLLGFWMLLSLHNIFKLNALVGFDYQYHIDYVNWIITNKRLPLATDGWQMFQPPLYYLVTIPFYLIFSSLFSSETSLSLLRIIPLACGALHMQLCFISLRKVFAGRRDLQVVGLVIGGLLPMNLYICQYVGNEPLAAVLMGAAIYHMITFGTYPEDTEQYLYRRSVRIAALFLGLAVLTKMTALLFVPVCIGYLYYEFCRRELLRSERVKYLLEFTGIICAICGWFYLRNWWLLGQPFIGGWESNALPWWQAPGFRTLGQLATFGDVVTRPVYAATVSFWNGLYSTFWADGYLSGMGADWGVLNWNYDFMFAGIILGFVPSFVIAFGFAGVAGGYGSQNRPLLIAAAASILVVVFAIFHLFLTVPIYSTAKASYSSGLTVAYALIAAAGYDLLCRYRWATATVAGLLACWAMSVIGAYFVV